MILEDLLHDHDFFMFIHHDDSIMDGEGDDTYRPEGFQDIHKNIRPFHGTAAFLSLRSTVDRLMGTSAISPKSISFFAHKNGLNARALFIY